MSELRVLLMMTMVGSAAWFGTTKWSTSSGLIISKLTVCFLVSALVIALAGRRELLVILLVTVLAFVAGSLAAQNYQVLPASQFQGRARLVTDPKPTPYGWRAEAKLADGNRVLVSGVGFVADPLGHANAGDMVLLEGSIRPAPDLGWFRSRHLVGRLSVANVRIIGSEPWYQAPSEWLRSAVRSGSRALDEQQRNLYLGLVIGDDRFQPASQRAQFRAAGLAHLLAVSGQNVAFVLAVVAPAVRRLGPTGRLVATFGVLIVFALATRMEPSVMRATAAAGIATVSVARGRPSEGIRTLSLAVTGLLLIDPLLVNSVGFGLSVAASLGILLLGPAIEKRTLRVGFLAGPLSVTLAAQIGVCPILLVVFGPVSLVSVPANVLAGWAAGAVMVWGLTMGVLAGLVPEKVGMVIQYPPALGLWWIDTVARRMTPLPVPAFGLAETLGLSGGVILVWAYRGRSGLMARSIVLASIIGLSALAVSAVPTAPTSGTTLAGDVDWWLSTASGTSILVVSADADDRVLDSLVASRVRSVDLVILCRGDRRSSQLLQQIEQIVQINAVVAPPDHQVIGARRLLSPLLIPLDEVIGTSLYVTPGQSRLEVEVQG